jgi:hypothetical protein
MWEVKSRIYARAVFWRYVGLDAVLEALMAER